MMLLLSKGKYFKIPASYLHKMLPRILLEMNIGIAYWAQVLLYH